MHTIMRLWRDWSIKSIVCVYAIRPNETFRCCFVQFSMRTICCLCAAFMQSLFLILHSMCVWDYRLHCFAYTLINKRLIVCVVHCTHTHTPLLLFVERIFPRNRHLRTPVPCALFSPWQQPKITTKKWRKNDNYWCLPK